MILDNDTPTADPTENGVTRYAVGESGSALSLSMGNTDEIVDAWCLRELSLWQASRPSFSEVMRNFGVINDQCSTVFLLRIDGDNVSVLDKPAFFTRAELDGTNPGLRRLALYRAFIERAAAAAESKIDTVIALDINDVPLSHAGAPIFGFQKDRGSRAILLPDVDFLLLAFYEGLQFVDDVPFSLKQDGAVFIGGTSGAGTITISKMKDSAVPRIRSAVYFKENPLIEFRLPNVGQCDSRETEDLIRAMGICGERATFRDQMTRKFMISMDGNGATCSRVAVALKSNCALLKYESPHLLYYFDNLVPWHHYIPIIRDSDVEKIVNLEIGRPGTFTYIAERSREFFDRLLTGPMVLQYATRLIQRYARLLSEPLPVQVPSVAAVPSGEQQVQVHVMLHVQDIGDTRSDAGGWHMSPQIGHAIEGFSVTPVNPYLSEHLEYKAIDRVGTVSAWQPAGQFCGTRGRNLQLCGVRFRVRGPCAASYVCTYQAVRVDGEMIGPVAASRWCRSDDDVPIAGIQIEIRLADTG